MPANDERDPLDRWLDQRVRPLPPPPGTFELITRRARRRKIRKAVVSAASAAAVAAAVAIAVPVTLSLQPTHSSAHDNLAAGNSPATRGTPAVTGAASQAPADASASGAASATTPAPNGQSTPQAGYLPPGFLPSSVTWDSLTTGWVLGRPARPGTAPTPTLTSARRSRAPATAARPGRACPRRPPAAR